MNGALPSEDRFAKAFNASPMSQLLIRRADRVFLAVNDAFARGFGYSRDEVIGKTADDLDLYVRKADRDAMFAGLAADGKVTDQELQLRTKSGDIRTVIWSIVVVDVDGEPTLLVAAHDITAQKETEQALRASEARFANAFRKSPLPSAIVRLSDYMFLDVNDAFLALFGYQRDDLVGTSALQHEFWVDRRERALVYGKFFAEGKLAEHQVRMLTKTREQRDILWSMESIKLGGEKSVMCQLQDVTKRNRDESALRESEALLRQLTDNIREVFWLAEVGRERILYVSPTYETIWGRPVASLLERASAWTDAIHPVDRDRVIAAALAQRVAGTYAETYRIVRPDGSIRWIQDRGFPVYDEAGVMIRFAGFAEDVSERLRLEDELRQTQKMESLGMLAGGVAHDFNNVLAVIASCSGLLSEDIPRAHPSRELVDEIEAAVTRATGLTRQLLAFSRKQVTDPKVIELNNVVSETRKMLRRMLGEDILLHVSLEPALGRVKVDPGYLVQVLMNLAVNARDAMPRGGTLLLSTRNAEITEHDRRRHPCAKVGAAVVLEVTDTGIGMPPHVIEHIFEPFFTTKAQHKGTGMGLAVVHGIIDQACGFIDVTSTPSVGTTFKVYLPVVDAAASSDEEIAFSLAHGSERILLVDDDDHVRRAAGRALRSRGYDVIEASGGEAALEHFHAGCAFDLLLTDVVMPTMDGRELAQAAFECCREIRVLYMSGYTDDAVVRHGVEQGVVELIEKPFRIDALARKVRQVLDGPGLRNPQRACGDRSSYRG